jgi:peptide/nickel transport system permease protein
MSQSSKRVRYVLKRLLQAVPVVLAIVVVNFFLLHLAEGDAADVLAGEAGSATPEYMQQLRQKFGLDKPLPVQLFIYLKNVLSFDLGYSFRHGMPVAQLVMDRFIPTLLLMVSTIFIAVGFGIVLGLLGAAGLNTWRDNLISIFALVSYATPLFWVGLMMIVVFSLKLHWFPTSGMENVVMFYEGWDRVKDIAHHLVMPTITLSLFYLALYTRLMRASMLEQAGMDYVVTARAKGLSERRILFVHVLRNALLPVFRWAH